ncbi:DUF6906 family protein [Paenibacillus ginsengarvi]|uniref:DUF6906 family protein n=1 Tax=Paenibacillus ginsengarvi TaxID=400777 RepID=UPI00145734B5|nr:hypothetical protein [Paenibacillus ginsengarvi]
MKHGKRPTRREKTMIAAAGLRTHNWLVTKRLPQSLHLTHRVSSTVKVIPVR